MGLSSSVDLRSPTAAVVFGDHVGPERSALEARALAAFDRWLKAADRRVMHGSCREIDELVVPTLSGPFLLQLAASIQERFPEVISNMPVLSSHLQVLARAEQAAKFFGKSNLSALCAAIAAEGAR